MAHQFKWKLPAEGKLSHLVIIQVIGVLAEGNSSCREEGWRLFQDCLRDKLVPFPGPPAHWSYHGTTLRMVTGIQTKPVQLLSARVALVPFHHCETLAPERQGDMTRELDAACADRKGP
ncbi:MAG TPA: hypothetical protein VG013_31835, partial [Gemmataceae bacterium]|nr:hypothetical protein [Gemmataceae bacterium]